MRAQSVHNASGRGEARATRVGRLRGATAARAAPPRRTPRTPAPAHAPQLHTARPPATAAASRTAVSMFSSTLRAGAARAQACGGLTHSRGAAPARCVTHLSRLLARPPSAETRSGRATRPCHIASMLMPYVSLTFDIRLDN
ncbi:unnamed protein product, partial [Brenthis ino]